MPEQDLDRVGFDPLPAAAAVAALAPAQLDVDRGRLDRHAGGKAVDQGQQRLAVRFAGGPIAACVIVKHANPCGVALATEAEEAYVKALACDPVSAYGGVVAVNRKVEAGLAEKLAEQFVEVLIAPDYTEEAVEILRRKESTRITSRTASAAAPHRASATTSACSAGCSSRTPTARPTTATRWRSRRSTSPTSRCGATCSSRGAWPSTVSSNAIVLAKGLQTIGIGTGQPSRVDATKIASTRPASTGHDPIGAALASDAFFPFADGPQVALDAGIAAIIQPGGSKRDDEVVEAVEAAGAAMVITGRRHFRH